MFLSTLNRIHGTLMCQCWSRLNQYSVLNTLSNIRFCHAAPDKLQHSSHHEKRNSHPKPARAILNQTFSSVTKKLKLPSIKPVYSTMPIHNKGSPVWKTVLTLKWPENLSFEAVGHNKKESEELVAQQALQVLLDTKIISSSGKLMCELSPHKTLKSPDNSPPVLVEEGPLPVSNDFVINKDDLKNIEEYYPNYKTTLLNCFIKVSNHMKDANYIVRPTFKRIGVGPSHWQASYSLKWPELREFSGIGKSRSTAEKWAILSALHWLVDQKRLHRDGYPNLFSEDEFQQWKADSKSPAEIKIPPKFMNELEKLVHEFRNLKPLIDQTLSQNDQELANNSLILEGRETEDAEDLEPTGRYATEDSTNESELSEIAMIDPITGRRVHDINPQELKKRCDELYLSAKKRIIDKSGFVVPYLPIIEKRETILDLIEKNRVIVLSGGTGCGKSTQVPQYLLDSYALANRGSECNIIVTQPRRLAALSLAQTVASHRGEKVGESVGYQVRLNSVLPRKQKGRILFCSTGILLRRIQACPELSGVSHLIIDEVHERDCLTDFTLVIIKDLLKINPNLKVILMSASLNADLLSRYFDSAPLVHVNGRTFPVKQSFLPDVLQLIKSPGNRENNSDKPLVDQNLIVKLIRYLDFNKPAQGSILCFLPGWAEIKSLHTKLKEFYPTEETHWVLPVHSRLSQAEQERIFDRPPDGVRKIVLATNIAETSLTINDCVYVIDPGVHKEMRYNSHRGSAVMENQWISKANVQQRAGRAGRVQPGESYHLYTQQKYEEMDPFPQAEILRVPLEKVVMDIKAYDENLKSTDFLRRTLEPPSQSAIQHAVLELESIDALDKNERLTPLGRRIAQFSTHPRLAKSLVYATLFRCLDPVASIVAGLSSAREGWSVDSTMNNQRQMIRQAKHMFHPTSDHLALSNLMRQFCEHRGRYQVDDFCAQVKANPKALYFLRGVKNLLVDHLCEANLLTGRSDVDSLHHPVNRNAHNEEMIKAALLMGFSDRILRVRRGRMIKGIIKQKDLVILSEKHGQVHLTPDSVNAEGYIKSDFLIFFNGVFSTERRALVVRDTSQVSNIVALLSAGRQLETTSVNNEESNEGNTLETIISVDRQSHLKFKCSSRESQLLMTLRSNLADTCDYLLRSAGLQAGQFSSEVEMFHDRQVDFLARLLLSSVLKK